MRQAEIINIKISKKRKIRAIQMQILKIKKSIRIKK